MVVNEAQYTVAVFAPFGPAASLSSPTGFRLRTPDDLDRAVAGLAGTFRISLPASLCPQQGVDVPVSDLAGFKPVNVARNCAWLRGIMDARAYIDEAARAGHPLTHVARKLREDFPGLPIDLTIPEAAASPAAPQAVSTAGSATVDAILDMVAAPEAQPAARPTTKITSWKSDLAGLAAQVLAAIYADPAFRAAEAAWRGVRLILKNAGPGSPLALDLIPADQASLPQALASYAKAAEKTPPGLILADVFLDAAPARLETWTALAEAADALLAPAAAALAPAFFHLDGWEGLSRIGYPARALDDAAYAKFRKLAETPGGGWLSALFPRAALRPAYGTDNPSRVAELHESEPLWGSAVWLLGAAVAGGLVRSGWPHLFEIGAGVSVGDLAVVVRGSRAMAVETLLSNDQLIDWASAGLTALGGESGGDSAFFRRAVTLDGSGLPARLFLNRVLGFFFACRANEELAGVLETSGPDGLAQALTKRFSLFFERKGHHAPQDLEIAPTADDGRMGLDIRFTPPPGLGMGHDRLRLGFSW